MYAVIETGGKQYRVEVGTELEVELLDVEPGHSVTLDRVLLVADGDDTAVGRPIVANAAVEAEVIRRERGAKVIVFKYRPKARRRVKKGHRQDHLLLRITDVRLNGKSAAEATRKAAEDARTERQRLEEAAARQAAADAELAAKLAKQQSGAASRANARTAEKATEPRTKKAVAAESQTDAVATEDASTTAPETTAPEETADGPGAAAATESETPAKRTRARKDT